MITRRAGQRCEACGATEDRAVQRRLEAHERWAHDERTGVQAIRRLICLCSECHLSAHLGYVTGSAVQALAHLRVVTGMTEAQAWRHVAAADEAWTVRSGRVWTPDLSMLTDAGVTVVRPERAADRPAAARSALHHADQQPGVTPPRTAPPTAGRTPVPAGEPPSAPVTVPPLVHPAGEARRVTMRGRLRCWVGE